MKSTMSISRRSSTSPVMTRSLVYTASLRPTSTLLSRNRRRWQRRKNRATAVAMNAEIRRTKARLLEEVPKLQRLAFKKVKGLSKEELEARNDLVSALKDRIEVISDGSATAAKQTGGGATSASYAGIKIDSYSGGKFDDGYFQETDESSWLGQEYEMRRKKQASILFGKFVGHE